MAYEMVMPYHLHMPSYFLETFTEYPYKTPEKEGLLVFVLNLNSEQETYSLSCKTPAAFR